MGTRSMTYIIDEFDGKTPIISQYRQYDGYVKSGHGQDIYNFLQNPALISNGIDDMAGQFVSYLKSNPKHATGGVYLYSLRKLPTQKQTFEQYRDKYLVPYAIDCGCDYTYIIRQINGQLEIQIYNWKEQIFTGTIQEMAENFDLNIKESVDA